MRPSRLFLGLTVRWSRRSSKKLRWRCTCKRIIINDLQMAACASSWASEFAGASKTYRQLSSTTSKLSRWSKVSIRHRLMIAALMESISPTGAPWSQWLSWSFQELPGKKLLHLNSRFPTCVPRNSEFQTGTANFFDLRCCAPSLLLMPIRSTNHVPKVHRPFQTLQCRRCEVHV